MKGCQKQLNILLRLQIQYGRALICHFVFTSSKQWPMHFIENGSVGVKKTYIRHNHNTKLSMTYNEPTALQTVSVI